MAERGDVTQGYATGLFHVASAEGELDRVSDELLRFAEAVEQNDELRTALTDLGVPDERKIAVVDELLGERASDLTRSAIRFVVGQGRARDLHAIAESLSEQAAEQRDRALAEVRSAVDLTPEQSEKLAEALERLTGKKVDVRVVVDPKVLGGVYARVGDKVIDATVRRRLDELKDRLGRFS